MRAVASALERLLRSGGIALAVLFGTGSAMAGPVVVSTTLAAEPTRARRGVVVVALGDTPTDVTWPVAKAIYADDALRPVLGDADARALAGDPTEKSRELAELRLKVTGEDVASRAILAEIARRTGARAIAIVRVVDGSAEVRVWDAASDSVGSTRHRKEASGWEPFVGNLRARYGIEPEKPRDPSSSKSSLTSSPWFWGALGVAVAGGVAVWAVTRDNGEPRPVRIEWGAR